MHLTRSPETLHIHMPTYNTVPFIGESIDAVLLDMEKSGINDYRLVISDDGSTDGTLDVVNSYSSHPRIHVLSNAVNIGVGANHIRLLHASFKDLPRPFAISFRDGDDVSIPGGSALLIEQLSRGPTDLVSGSIIEFSEYNGREQTGIERFRHTCTDKMKRDVVRGHIPSWNPASMVRTEAFDDYGVEYPNVRYCDDLLFQAQLLFNGANVVNLAEPVIYYRKHESSVTTGRNPSNAKPYISACQQIWAMANSAGFEVAAKDKAYVVARAAAYLVLSSNGTLYRSLRSLYRLNGRFDEVQAPPITQTEPPSFSVKPYK